MVILTTQPAPGSSGSHGNSEPAGARTRPAVCRSCLGAWPKTVFRDAELNEAPPGVPEFLAPSQTTGSWFIQPCTASPHLCVDLYSEVVNIYHRATGSYQSWPSKKFSARKIFHFLITHLVTKPDLKWCEAIYCLYFSHLVWTVHCRKLMGLIMEHCPGLHGGIT